jgi:AraC-like DNA-binding protein
VATPNLIHHFATAALASAKHHAIDSSLLIGVRETMRKSQWNAEDLLRFTTVLRENLQDEFYGLASSRCPPGASHLSVELMLLSKNLGDALQRYCRFYEMATDGLKFELRDRQDLAHIDITAADSSRDEHHFLMEWQAIRWHKLAQWLIGENIPLISVEFMHSSHADPAEYAEAFGIECWFDRPCNRLSFPRDYLKRNVVRRMADFEAAKAKNHNLLVSPEIHPSWRNLLTSSLCARLSKKLAMPTMEELAREFDICSQTLRRRLKEENCSYRQLKAEARRELILDSISNDNLSLSQVSLLAGFSDVNGLAKLTKAWAGLSPSQYRIVAREAHDDAL